MSNTAEFQLYQMVVAAVMKGDGNPLRTLAKAVETKPVIHPIEANILEVFRRTANRKGRPRTVEDIHAALNKQDPRILQWWKLFSKDLDTETRRYLEDLFPYLAHTPATLGPSRRRQILRACKRLGIELVDGRLNNRRRP